MHLNQTYALLLSLGILASTSAVLSGCSPSESVSRMLDHSHTMPTGEDMPVAEHAMMDIGPKDTDFDRRFIDAMVLHHEGAIAMAEAAVQNSQRNEVKELAQKIISAQAGEIAQMKSWRQTWYPQATAELVMYDAQMGHTMAMSDEMQASMRMDSDLSQADAEFDRRFIDGMIVHHEGALAMAQQGMKNSDRPEIQQVSKDILKAQQAEIDLMNQWKSDWYGS